ALAVQLRAKHLGGAALYAAAVELRAATRAVGAALWVNDRLDVALAVEADGVHLPEAGLPVAAARAVAPGVAIGVSRHRVDLDRAADRAVDVVQLGPIWATPSKAGMGDPLGPAALAAARSRVAGQLVAVGGVDDPARVAAAIAAGADAVAAIRAWWCSDDPGAVAAAWWAIVARARE
ncbi:MAG: thiamine phosphate synthase, partial [Myxococcales bacterium]|nr:thiamine phosphate synthase [Myxococcales bacterium]